MAADLVGVAEISASLDVSKKTVLRYSRRAGACVVCEARPVSSAYDLLCETPVHYLTNPKNLAGAAMG